MDKARLLATIDTLNVKPEVKLALVVIANDLPDRPDTEDGHGHAIWLVGKSTDDHAICLSWYPE